MFQLPGLVLVNVFEEEEDDEDAADKNLCMRDDDNSPCKHTPVTSRDPENCSVTPSDRRHCILEEVDGELEMEDVSGHHKDERPLVNDGSVDLALLELNPDGLLKSPSNISTEYLPSPEGSPPLPPGSPPPTPPLPTSPPPSSPPPPPPPLSSPPQPPPPPPPTTQQHPFPQPPVPPQPPIGPPPHVGPTPPVGPLPPHLRPPPHMGPLHPPFGPPPHLSHPVQLTTQQSFPSQPPLVSQNKTPPALPHPLPHEVGTTQTVSLLACQFQMFVNLRIPHCYLGKYKDWNFWISRQINRVSRAPLLMGLIMMHLVEVKCCHNNHLISLLLGPALHENMVAIIHQGMGRMMLI